MHGVMMPAETESYVYQGECHWIALLTQPSSERKACIWLRRRQFEPYWPRYKGQIKLSRHRRAIRWRGVIPGYLFLPIVDIDNMNWPLLDRAPGIHGKITNGEGYAKRLTQSDIDDIQKIEAALNSSELCAAEGIPFKVGQRVRPVDDMFGNWEGSITRIDNRRQIAIEVPGLFGRTTVVMFSAEKLEAV
jgi:transcription antitermination factor NusG